MEIIGVIPARWASTRFPGKVLADLNGRPLIWHVWNQARQAAEVSRIVIACDDERVRRVCEDFGARAVMTSSHHASGTDRIAEAVRDIPAEIIVNIQGDEPLIDPKVIDRLAVSLRDDPVCPMATVIVPIRTMEELTDPNVVKAVISHGGRALYFSRHAIPYNRDQRSFEEITAYKHLGLYAYRRDFLLRFYDLPASSLEAAEKLEQLRVLEAGYSIQTITVSCAAIGVDTPEDLARVRQQLCGEGNGKNS